MSEAPYAIVTGNGRSGTNWLESILDASPDTLCRSEPYDIPSSPFNRIPQLWQEGAASRDLDRDWDEVVHWSRRHIGERDHGFEHPKSYCYSLPQQTRLVMLMAHTKSRRLLGLLQPSLRRGEWPMPWWAGNAERMAEAYAVFKINLDRLMLSWLLEKRSDARVLHIVRHPCGRLNSWFNRFVAMREEQQVLAERKTRLGRIAAIEPEWRDAFGKIENLSLVEAEVWFWRYTNESVYRTGNGHPRYVRVVYEDLSEDPISKARALYSFCNIEWSQQAENILGRGIGVAESSRSIARTWKTSLPAEHIRTVESIVKDSPIIHWWN